MTFLNIPNILTIARLISIPFFILSMLHQKYEYALIIFSIAAITDVLDGFLARMANQKTKLGAFLDPLADKFLLLTSFIIFTTYGWLPSWIAITVISRDVIVILGWIILVVFTHNKKVEPSLTGKLANAFQAILIVYVLVSMNFEIDTTMIIKQLVVILVAALTVFSGIQYIYKGYRRLNER
jgi:cardiolipin synthase